MDNQFDVICKVVDQNSKHCRKGSLLKIYRFKVESSIVNIFTIQIG